MAEGTVRWFDTDKGYGFIGSDDGPDVYVHHTAIAGAGPGVTLGEGDRVQFEVSQGQRGPQADDVRKL